MDLFQNIQIRLRLTDPLLPPRFTGEVVPGQRLMLNEIIQPTDCVVLVGRITRNVEQGLLISLPQPEKLTGGARWEGIRHCPTCAFTGEMEQNASVTCDTACGATNWGLTMPPFTDIVSGPVTVVGELLFGQVGDVAT